MTGYSMTALSSDDFTDEVRYTTGSSPGEGVIHSKHLLEVGFITAWSPQFNNVCQLPAICDWNTSLTGEEFCEQQGPALSQDQCEEHTDCCEWDAEDDEGSCFSIIDQ